MYITLLRGFTEKLGIVKRVDNLHLKYAHLRILYALFFIIEKYAKLVLCCKLRYHDDHLYEHQHSTNLSEYLNQPVSELKHLFHTLVYIL